MNGDMKMQESDGYPSIQSRLLYVSSLTCSIVTELTNQLISVISLLSADVPDLNSPANVDAAKEVRENFPCKFSVYTFRRQN